MDDTKFFELIGYKHEGEGEVEPDKVREHLEANYVPVSALDKDDRVRKHVDGKVAGKTYTMIAQAFEQPHSSYKDRDVSVKDYLLENVGSLKTKLTELEEKANSGNDEKITSLQAELDKATKLNVSMKEANTELETNFNQFKEKSAGEFKALKVKTQYQAVKGQIPFSANMTEAEKFHYDNGVMSKYSWEESDGKWLGKKDGEYVKSKKGTAGDFADMSEIMKMEADSHGYLQKNNAGGQKVEVKPPAQNGNQQKNTKSRILDRSHIMEMGENMHQRRI